MADEVEFVSDEDVPRVGKHVSSYERNTFSEEKPVSGTEVFGFKTPKRRGALAQAVSSAIHKKTPQIQRNKTPSSKKKDLLGHNTTRKAEQVIPPVEAGKENINTRYSLRCRSQAMFMKGTERESDSDDDNSTTEGTVPRTFSMAAGKGHVSLTDTPEEYFHQQSSKCVTSDHTLSKLHIPHMDQQNLQIQLSEVSSTHPKERFDIYHRLQPLFNKWIFHLKNGFNILLYGLGSKRVLLDQFRCSKLVGCMQVVVNGFFPSLTIKNVLNIITEEGLGYEGTFRSHMDQCDFIKHALSSDTMTEEIYLIIHNIDGSMLRSKKSQIVLSLLAEVDALHVIATIDHINAPLIWNHTQLGRFNWSWFDVTSFEPYKEETSYENSLLVQRTGGLALSSLVHVFRSLTPNAQGIFLLITGNQLEEKDNTTYIGLSFTECYTKCREQFLVNSELTLRAQLTEFRDHKLIRSKKGPDGVEYLYIPVDSSTLKQFIDDQQNNNT